MMPETDYLQIIERIGYGGAILFAALGSVGWICVRLFGQQNGILTTLANAGVKTLATMQHTLDEIRPAIQTQASVSQQMLDLHITDRSPCNTMPLRRAGAEAAAAIGAIGKAVGADVQEHVDAIRDELRGYEEQVRIPVKGT